MKILSLLLASVALLGGQDKKPNILFILSDDQGWTDYGFMGHPEIETPTLDRLASESLTFTRGYTPVPLCRPSLASILTGLYPHQHGITGNDPALPDKDVDPKRERANPEYSAIYENLTAQWRTHPNWVRSLGEAGYRSLQTGKWWEGDPVENGDFTLGMTTGDPAQGGRHGDAGLKIGRDGLQPIKDFIAAGGDEPWFIWYGVYLPHSPHNPPQELLDKYLAKTDNEHIAAYWACCEWLDQSVAELLAHLEERGELENTLIIYTCDNGWIQSPKSRDSFEPRSKQSPYEGGIRTPLMFSWKGHITPRMETKHLASNLDIWPTAAKLCGTPLPEGLPGIDLIDEGAVAARKSIFGAHFLHDIPDIKNPERGLKNRFIIKGNWKLILPKSPRKKMELYNLAVDPVETNNLIETETARARTMTAETNAWWAPSPAD